MTEPNAPDKKTCRLEGHLELATYELIEGWAINHNTSGERVPICIFANDTIIWEGFADRPRRDLIDARIGDGAHSFSVRSLQFPVADVVELRVTMGEMQQDIFGSPTVLPARLELDRRESTSFSTPVSQQNEKVVAIRGVLDSIDHSYIRGWAQNINLPDRPVYLELYVDGSLNSSGYANVFREDLKRAGIGNHHGFVLRTPLALLDGLDHSIRIVAANSNAVLPPGDLHFKLDIPLPLRYFAEVRDVLSAAATRLSELETLVAPEIGERLMKRTAAESVYQKWFRKYAQLTNESRSALHARWTSFESQPKFSILMPTFNTPPGMLRAAVESIRCQLYPVWELCIADDSSTSTATLNVLRDVEQSDARIRVHYRSENGHISQATNSALAMASGDYICLFDHDDLLSEDALFQLCCAVNEHPYDLIYSDEDKIDNSGVHHDPHFKPSFNYTLLLSYNYICHLLCVKSDLVAQVGGFRSETDGSQDYDFVLRCIDKTTSDKIKHIPLILYHWRAHAGSTAASIGVKNYAVTAGELAIQSHLSRVGVEASVSVSPIFSYRVAWPIPANAPLVSAVIPTRDNADALAICLSGLLNGTDYANIEVIIIDNGSIKQETFDLFEVAKNKGVKIIRHDAPFNYSEICNLGAKFASGDNLLMLNNDIEVLQKDWLTELVSQVARPGIAAAGAKLLYPDRRIQHAGVILGIGGVAGHAHKLLGCNETGYMARAIVAHELSACTAACLLIDRRVFETVGGFNEKELAVAFNDVDLCLKIREAGYGIVFTPYAELIHHESLSRGFEDVPSKVLRAQSEVAYMKARWGRLLEDDPCYSPNLTLIHEDFGIDIDRGVANALYRAVHGAR